LILKRENNCYQIQIQSKYLLFVGVSVFCLMICYQSGRNAEQPPKQVKSETKNIENIQRFKQSKNKHETKLNEKIESKQGPVCCLLMIREYYTQNYAVNIEKKEPCPPICTAVFDSGHGITCFSYYMMSEVPKPYKLKGQHH
jgi:hypothetical protein